MTHLINLNKTISPYTKKNDCIYCTFDMKRQDNGNLYLLRESAYK